MRVCVCVRACVRARVCVCVRARVQVCGEGTRMGHPQTDRFGFGAGMWRIWNPGPSGKDGCETDTLFFPS